MRLSVIISAVLFLGACVGDMGPRYRPYEGDGGLPEGGSGDADVDGYWAGDTEVGDEPPTRPVEDSGIPEEDGGPPVEDSGPPPVPELSPPGGTCLCDSDCEGTGGFAPLCIHGICGVSASDNRCSAGSTHPCPAGHRCWSGTGQGVCYPDFVPGQCVGREDYDGSCVTDGDSDCFRVCGSLCDLAGSPPGTDDPPDDPCGGLDYYGECAGDIARWCADGRIQEIDCTTRGQVCRHVDDTIGWFCTDGGGGGPPTPDAGTECDDPVVIEEIRLTNDARRSAGLGALTCDNGLTRAAYLHSQDMCHLGYFSHTSRDGRNFSDRIRAQGVTFGYGGENIAWGQSSAAEVHRTWMNSRGHRANILGSGYRRIGVGYEPCGGRPMWTQNFTD